MHPFGFNRIQPRALAGQTANNETTTAFPFDSTIVCRDPFPYDLTLVPRSIVPNQEQCALSLNCKARQEPRQERTGDATDGATYYKAHEHLRQSRDIESITGNRLGFGIGFRNLLFHHAKRLIFSPRMKRRLFLTTPPRFVGKAKRKVGMRFSQANESLTLFFLTHSVDPG